MKRIIALIILCVTIASPAFSISRPVNPATVVTIADKITRAINFSASRLADELSTKEWLSVLLMGKKKREIFLDRARATMISEYFDEYFTYTSNTTIVHLSDRHKVLLERVVEVMGNAFEETLDSDTLDVIRELSDDDWNRVVDFLSPGH